MNERPIHVVGGGIAGLVAAITAAEGGAPVVLHEGGARLGGRAVGSAERPWVNLGPHVVFTDGALVRWLRQRRIDVPLCGPMVRGVRMLDDRGARFPFRQGLQLLPTILRREAPVDETFRAWAENTFGDASADLLCRLGGLITYHHDPGALSARFMWDRYRRTALSPDRVRWVAGGWVSLVDALAERARTLGVRIELDDRLTPESLPDAPTVVATKLSGAGRLLERDLSWPGARTALLDVATTADPGWPAVIADVRSDLATCCMIERETAADPAALGEEGGHLIQAQLGVAPGVGVAEGVSRIEDGLDVGFPGWREAVGWRRAQIVVDGTGAVDPPGTTWRDRPSVEQGDDVFLAGDAVAAPGFLSEVSVNSAVQAGRLALDARRRRAFAPGWPTAELTPERRLAVLAAVLPSAELTTTTVPGADEVAPVDETGPGYRIERRAGVTRATAATAGKGGVRVTRVVASALPGVARAAVERLPVWRRPFRR
ncbi:MAG: NAD(P)-binding protein [Acidimicrobiia bacterium]|nr:NAD(P)-binding protein [Acidimicrobiia bacterium]